MSTKHDELITLNLVALTTNAWWLSLQRLLVLPCKHCCLQLVAGWLCCEKPVKRCVSVLTERLR